MAERSRTEEEGAYRGAEGVGAREITEKMSICR